METSLFTKIINGEIPSHKIYEDEHTYAFLDIYPTQPGHTLVVPKIEIDKFEDLPDEDYQHLMATVKKLAKHLAAKTGKRTTLKVIGFDVPHAHIHLVPVANTDEFMVRSDMNKEPDHAALAKIAEELALN